MLNVNKVTDLRNVSFVFNRVFKFSWTGLIGFNEALEVESSGSDAGRRRRRRARAAGELRGERTEAFAA